MTPFQWGMVTGAFLGLLIELVVVGVWVSLSRPRRHEISRDEIAAMKGAGK